MSSRAAGATLEIVRVLCMHMGDDIIFFIANAWPSPPHTHTPPVVPLDLCVILHDSSKKKQKKNGQKNNGKAGEKKKK